jgi:hypothetical protein
MEHPGREYGRIDGLTASLQKLMQNHIVMTSRSAELPISSYSFGSPRRARVFELFYTWRFAVLQIHGAFS